MHVNKDGVPPDKLNDPRLLALEASMLSEMQDPVFRLRSCAHEAAHAIYARRAGFQKVDFYGPRIEWDSTLDKPIPLSGGIRESELINGTCDLALIAEIAVAGSVFEYTCDRGTAKNVETHDMAEFWAKARKTDPGLTNEEIADYWRKAKNKVGKNLRRHPAVKAAIRKLAREYEAQLMNDEAK
jgi:hypothetical protein